MYEMTNDYIVTNTKDSTNKTYIRRVHSGRGRSWFAPVLCPLWRLVRFVFLLSLLISILSTIYKSSLVSLGTAFLCPCFWNALWVNAFVRPLFPLCACQLSLSYFIYGCFLFLFSLKFLRWSHVHSYFSQDAPVEHFCYINFLLYHWWYCPAFPATSMNRYNISLLFLVFLTDFSCF